MDEGYVYILQNQSISGLKIGCSAYGAQRRAQQLSASSAVPLPFTVAYEVYVSNHKKLEKSIHGALSSYRINNNREFFAVEVQEAVDIIESLRKSECYAATDYYEAYEVLPRLRLRYGQNIKDDIVSARVFQQNDRVYFEVTRNEYISNYLKDQYIHRTDMAFIAENYDVPLFQTTDPIDVNVQKFLDLDDISMANCFLEIFIEDWNPL